jgi:futalosine hydrolase
MDLVVTATPQEMTALQKSCPSDVLFLVSGVGLVETAFTLTAYLCKHPEISRVFNVGIAGGFPSADMTILDCCLATSETIGDLGIYFDSHMEPLDPLFLTLDNQYPCSNSLYAQFNDWLNQTHHAFQTGRFLSVNGVSGSLQRGKMVNRNHCLCENMEGAAVARVCTGLKIDWLEFRVVSNLVEDRDRANWQIQPAIDKYSEIMTAFFQDRHS